MPISSTDPRRTTWRVLTAIAIASLLTALLLFLGGTSARAAEAGPGFSPNGNPNSFVGAMSFDGTNAYCIELTKDSPIGAPTVPLSTDAPLPAQLAALSADDRARLNWAVATAGASSDPIDTAATAIYVWWLADPAGYVLRDRNDEHYLGLIPAGERPAVRERLAELRSGAAAISAAPAPAAVSIELVEDARGVTMRLGEVPAGSVATVQVRGGTILGERLADGRTVVSGVAASGVGAAPVAAAPVGTLEMVLPAGAARDLAVSRESGLAFEVVVTVQLAASAWTPDLRVLVTEGRQLLIQSVAPVEAISQARFDSVELEDSTPLPSETLEPSASPEPTPKPDPVATPQPSVAQEPTPSVSPEPEPTPEPAPEPEPEPKPTTEPEVKPNPAPEPEARPETDPQPQADPPAAAPETTAPTPTTTPPPTPTPQHVTTPKPPSSAPTRPTASESPTATPSTATELASTGALFDPVTLLVPLGLSVVLLAAGGLALTRSKRVLRDEVESSW